MLGVKKTYTLGIETSCDDTALALLCDGEIVSFQKKSQIIHSKTKGIVPQVAAKEHLEQIDFLFQNCLQEAGVSLKKINSIGVTSGPGLIGALAVGASWAAGLAESLKIPVYGINHLEGHIFTLFFSKKKPSFPSLVLLASGGHTMLLNWNYPKQFERLFNTRDDSAGEAFDKVAKMLNLGFPGGPEIEQRASIAQNPRIYQFTIPMRGRVGFSFSGLKTEARKRIQEEKDLNLSDFCAGFQHTVFQHLIQQTEKKLKQKKYKSLGLVGGVSANKKLRRNFEHLAEKHSVDFVVPPLKLSTDNGVMPAIVAERMYSGEIAPSRLTKVFPRFTMSP